MKLYFAVDHVAFKCRLVVYDEDTLLLSKISGYKHGDGYGFKTYTKLDATIQNLINKVNIEQVKEVTNEYVSTLSEFDAVSLIQAIKHANYGVKTGNWAIDLPLKNRFELLIKQHTQTINGQHLNFNSSRLPVNSIGVPVISAPTFKVCKCLDNEYFETRLYTSEYYRFINYVDNNYLVVEDNVGDFITVAKSRFQSVMDFTDIKD